MYSPPSRKQFFPILKLKLRYCATPTGTPKSHDVSNVPPPCAASLSSVTFFTFRHQLLFDHTNLEVLEAEKNSTDC